VRTPKLNAMMCDGMGSFSDTDYKRMLLAFDQIYYLLPEESVEFRDVTGRPAHLWFPARLRAETTVFTPCSYALDAPRLEAVLRASEADLTADALRAAVGEIPADERLYAWRVVNADAGFAGGRSIGLSPDQTGLAQLLLNKFLVATDVHRSVPITGKRYVHRLLTLKYQHAERAIARSAPDVLPSQLRRTDLGHGPFVMRLISEFVSDAELEIRSFSEIAEYKRRNVALFEEFSRSVRLLVRKIESLPTEAAFQRDVSDILETEVWRAHRDLEREMRSAWDTLFRSGVKEAIKSDRLKVAAATAAKAAGSAVAVGVLPHLSPGALTWASVLAAGGAVAPWLIAELVEAVGKRRDAHRHGLYYLVGFGA
jgi:hypothetical protein